MSKVYSEPSKVEEYGGEVMVEGPDSVDISLTPEAAIETGARLVQAGAQAVVKRQKREKED